MADIGEFEKEVLGWKYIIYYINILYVEIIYQSGSSIVRSVNKIIY